MNIYPVSALIVRGSQPMGPQDWRLLKGLGICHVLDLQTGFDLLRDGDPLDQALAGESFGLRVWASPLSEIVPPSQGQLKSAAKFIDDRKNLGVYVHCKEGVDRTGIVIAYYRVHYQGWSVAAAVKEMHDMGMHAIYYPWEVVL